MKEIRRQYQIIGYNGLEWVDLSLSWVKEGVVGLKDGNNMGRDQIYKRIKDGYPNEKGKTIGNLRKSLFYTLRSVRDPLMSYILRYGFLMLNDPSPVFWVNYSYTEVAPAGLKRLDSL